MLEIVIGLLLLYPQAPKPEYIERFEHTYIKVEGKAIDTSGNERRTLMSAGFKGREYQGKYAVAFSIEMKPTRNLAQYFNGVIAVACGSASPMTREAEHRQVAFDAETAGAQVILEQAEFEALIKCVDPRLTVAGITVKFPDKEKARLRELRAALK